MRQIKFKRVFFIKGVFSHICEWGVNIKNARFTTPSTDNFTDSFIDCQFTGLKDKNGKDIYEGDILKKGDYKSFVVWCLDGWRFNSYMEGGSQSLYSNVDTTTSKECAEIIGNIHDNPELLK